MTLRGGPYRSSSSAATVPGWRPEDFLRFETNFLEEGVVSGLAVSQHAAGANMSVDVAAGLALVNVTTTLLTPNETVSTWLSNDDVVVVTVPTADSTNPRKDRIVAKFNVTVDPNAAASSNVSIELVQGAPAGSPSAPAEPSNAITLAIIDVPASDTTISAGQITDSRTYVTLDTAVLADLARVTNLASTASGKGASLIGVEDAGGQYTATTVEGALAEIDARLDLTLTNSAIGLYGDGNDGAVTWSSNTNLDPSTEKRYTTATLNSSTTLSVSSVNTPLVIHSTGNVTVNGTVDLNSKGGAGASAPANNANGSAGTAGNSLISGYTNAASGGGNKHTGGSDTSGGGGGGASAVGDGTAGTQGGGSGGAGGGAGAAISANKLALLSTFLRGVVCGGGGGSGGSQTSSAGGAGGAGGGAIVWFIGGSLTLGNSSVIRANGANGSNGGTDAAGGGGGGGGTIRILVAGSITNSGVTATATAGSGGTGNTGSGNGGAGAAGRVIIYSLTTGTLITA